LLNFLIKTKENLNILIFNKVLFLILKFSGGGGNTEVFPTTIGYTCDTLRMRQFLSQILIIDSTKQTGYNEEKFALNANRQKKYKNKKRSHKLTFQIIFIYSINSFKKSFQISYIIQEKKFYFVFPVLS